MIITVTLNPSLDRTVEVEHLISGRVLRARRTHLHPGGKGVNVTRALLANGVESLAVLPVGGADGDRLVELLTLEGVNSVLVPVHGGTRSNITIAEASGIITKINEPGAALLPEDLDRVVEHVLANALPGSWVVLCGSLPPGVPDDYYAVVTRRLNDVGVRVAVDTSGKALAHAVSAGPELIKPNAEELAGAVGRTIRSLSDVVDAAQELRRAGARRVLVSLGAAGALLVDDDGVAAGEGVALTPRSTVGAGDAFLAGFLAADPGGSSQARGSTALLQALAWGAAAVQLPGSQMPGPSDIDPGAAHLLRAELLDERFGQPLVGTG